MPKKITQAQLNSLITENVSSSAINLKQLLKSNGYKPDIGERYFDGKILNVSGSSEEKTLDFSGLDLTNTNFVNLKALTISFAGSNLTNASLHLESVTAIDFTEANLTRCFINEIKAVSVSFTDAIVEDTMIFKKFTSSQSFLTPVQQAEITSLDIVPGTEFQQADMIKKYSSELQSGGFCVGGGVEYARHALKSMDRGEEPKKENFTTKLAKKMANRSENFLQRIHDYQEERYSIDYTEIIPSDIIENNNFTDFINRKLKDANFVSCLAPYGNDRSKNHVFTVATVRNTRKEIEGYKILDLNFGEISCDLDSLEENQKKCNLQVNLLCKHYQEEITDRDKIFTVTDLDQIIQNYQLVRPKYKYKKSDKYLNKIVPSSRGGEDIAESDLTQQSDAGGYGSYVGRLLGEWIGGAGSKSK